MMPKFICPECNETFDTSSQFLGHGRVSGDCSQRKQSEPEGIDDVKLKQLKARQKGQTTERQKWEWMYHILFPDDDIIPSPCAQTLNSVHTFS